MPGDAEDQPIKREPQPEDSLAHANIPDLALYRACNFLDTQSVARLASACDRFAGLFRPVLQQRATLLLPQENALPSLLQAVIDGRKVEVRRMLAIRPDLLLLDVSQIPGIQSQLSWQIFAAEPIIKIAIQRNQIEILEVIIEAIKNAGDRLTQEQQVLLMAQWEEAEANLKALKARSRQFDFQPLIKVIIEGVSPEGVLSPEVEAALHDFRKTLLPDAPIKLGDYYDIMELLTAACKAYETAVNIPFSFDLTRPKGKLRNQKQYEVFCSNIIGMIQSLLPPEDAEKFCQGLINFSYFQKKEVSERARLLQVSGCSNFYRASRKSVSGLGYDCMCDESGGLHSFICRVDSWSGKSMSELCNYYMGGKGLKRALREEFFSACQKRDSTFRP
ncbi:MAG: hypothetical protein K0U29_08185 [Gammaproteobacteria bacterium]|nr:hypothetical protein [Gammaproteobacteria bacterium]